MSGGGDRAAEQVYALARAVVELADATATDPFRLPYPRIVQRIFDGIVLACLRNGEPAPTSVPDLVRRFTEGEGLDPPIALPPWLVPPAPALISANHLPTRTCLELASAGPHGGLAQEAEARLAKIAETCSTLAEFAVCRDLLMDNVIVDLNAERTISGDPGKSHLWARVKELYRADIPSAYVTRARGKRLVASCPTCGFPAPQVAQESWLCETGYCPPTGEPLLRALDEVRLLPAAYRVFLALPGSTERWAHQRLAALGIRMMPIPTRLTAYTFHHPSGVPGILRIFDREQPALLADELSQDSDMPNPPDITVIPDRIVERRPDYIALLTKRLSEKAQHRVVPAADLESAVRHPFLDTRADTIAQH